MNGTIRLKEIDGKLTIVKEGGIGFSGMLYEKLENVQKIRAKKWDCIFLIDGDRRAGKSTLGLTCAKILQPNLTINNVASGMQDAIEKIKHLHDGSVLLIDEGSLVFNNKESMNKEQVHLMKIIDVVGQKQMVLIVILPSFFDLHKNIAVAHSRFLLHVYTGAQMERGYFAYFGKDKKRTLYTEGKKNFGSYKYPSADFTDRFVDYNPLGQEYLDLKKQSLLEALEPKTEYTGRRTRNWLIHRNQLIWYCHRVLGFTHNKIIEMMNITDGSLADSDLPKIIETIDQARKKQEMTLNMQKPLQLLKPPRHSR